MADTLKAGENSPGLRAVVVARQGTLVAERYYAGATAENLLSIHSATKSSIGQSWLRPNAQLSQASPRFRAMIERMKGRAESC